ncbi:MAG TPA: hypothetical protein VGS20_12650 [Candidatus Acidoferrales bacterium]|nr:hypothetical protein [Candidatus Acidoferrales bacterium]
MCTRTGLDVSIRSPAFQGVGLLLGFLVISAGPLSRAPAAPPQVRAPAVGPADLLWTIDLSARGFPSLPWSTAAQARSSFENLGFAGSSELVAAYLVPESAAPYSPRRVRCILLDVRTGRVLGEREWSVLMSRVGLLATREGKFAVRTNNALTLYSGRFQAVARLATPVPSPAFDQWTIGVTPDRNLVVVQHYTREKTDIRWLDSASLAPRRSWSSTSEKFEDDWDSLRFSDTLMARVRLAGIEVREIGGPWTLAFGAGPGFAGQLSARFLTADALLVSEGRSLSVVRSDADILLAQPLDEGEFIAAGAARSSADGRRFALPVAAYNATGAQLALERIVVYDWSSRRWLCQLDNRRPGFKGVWAFALSPDGSSVALASGGAVRLYRLPR